MFKKRKRVFTLLVGIFLCLGLCSCIATSEGKKEENLPTLIIGSDNYPPFFYLDDDGEFEGIDVEIAQEACARIGRRPVFKQISWQNKDRYLSSGQVDCLWGCFSMNGREERYTWAGPYMHSRQIVMVQADSNIWKFSDLNGKSIAVQNASKPEELFLSNAVSGVDSIKNVYCFNSMNEVFAALRKGYVDACAGHETACSRLISSTNGNYRFLDECLIKANLGVAFSKECNNETVEKLSKVLFEMKKDGTIAEILEKYGLEAETALAG